MYSSVNVAEKIKQTSKNEKVQLKIMLEELNLNKNTLSNMYNGSMLKADSLARIADYLNCSVDYLLGRSSYFSTIEDKKTLKLIEYFSLLNEQSKDSLIQYIEFISSKPENFKNPPETFEMNA